MTLALERPTGQDISFRDSPARQDRRPVAVVPAAVDIDELVRTHLPLVGHVVREMLSRVPAHVRRDDLVSAGMFALATCAKTFDPGQNVTFAAYASFRIRGAMTDELRSMDWASRSVRNRSREVETTRTALTQALGRTPTTEEMARTMGTSVQDLASVHTDVQRASVLSLQSMVSDQADSALPIQHDGPESLLLRREQLGYLRDAIAELPERLATVIEQYFFQQRRMVDIAESLGVTESRVSQLRSEALTLLREGMRPTTDAPPAPSGTGRKAKAVEAYSAAVAARSTIVTRLSATNLLAEYRT